ncbi:MAG: MOSC domain-containing protein [Alphaproteobacteria bacterium]|nr:MOSC domain-containing protein [Alphaproteobacteria bacterium]
MGASSFSILSVNVGLPKVIGVAGGEPVLSGIAKHPVCGAQVMVRTAAIDGDGQADLENHGGADKAVYVYPAVHWSWWESEHRLPCRPATFGENLTLENGDERDVAIGDRFRWGEVLLEISQPRMPCFKLAMHARSDVPHVMTVSGRCGWYMRVITEGEAPVPRSALIRVAPGEGPSVRDSFVTVVSSQPDPATLHRIHETPALSAAWRRAVARKIAALAG